MRSANGFVSGVILGTHPEATDGYDESFDIVESFFLPGGPEIKFRPRQETENPELPFPLSTYFYYPDNPLSAQGSLNPESTVNPGSTVALAKSIIRASDNMTWPLQIAYLYPEDTVITLQWDAGEARNLVGYAVELVTPFGEVVSVTDSSSYSFSATLDVYDFSIRVVSTSGSGSDLGVLGLVVAGYLSMVAFILWFRRIRNRREQIESVNLASLTLTLPPPPKSVLLDHVPLHWGLISSYLLTAFPPRS